MSTERCPETKFHLWHVICPYSESGNNRLSYPALQFALMLYLVINACSYFKMFLTITLNLFLISEATVLTYEYLMDTNLTIYQNNENVFILTLHFNLLEVIQTLSHFHFRLSLWWFLQDWKSFKAYMKQSPSRNYNQKSIINHKDLLKLISNTLTLFNP